MRNLQILLCVLFTNTHYAQQLLKAHFYPKESFEIAVLYQITPENLKYKTHTKFDDNGAFTIILDSTYTSGMYKLVYALPQELNNFDFIFNGNETIELNFDLQNGPTFLQSDENITLSNYTTEMSKVIRDIEQEYNKKTIDTTAINRLFKRQNHLQKLYETQAEGLLTSVFLVANRRYVPKQYEPINLYLEHAKSHFFDAVDFENPLLTTSKFLVNRALQFVFDSKKMDSVPYSEVIENISDLNKLLQTKAPITAQYQLMTALFSELISSNNEPAALYMSKTILKPLTTTIGDVSAYNDILDFERTALGAKAPDFEIDSKTANASPQTLYDLSGSQRYILVFWSSSCSHCMNEMPAIHEMASAVDSTKVRVVAIALEDDIYQWNNFKYEWTAFTHTLALGKWEHPIVGLYNVPSTPHFLVLDCNKVIVAKPQTLEELKSFFQK